jgi:hypothetical protein
MSDAPLITALVNWIKLFHVRVVIIPFLAVVLHSEVLSCCLTSHLVVALSVQHWLALHQNAFFF